MSDPLSLGKNAKYGSINLNNVKSGIKKENIVGDNKKLESIFNSVDKDGNGVLDRDELQELHTKLSSLAGNDKLSKREAKKFTDNDGNKIGRKNANVLYDFLNKISAGSKDVKSITTKNVDGQDVEVITYKDNHTEELYPDGTKITQFTSNNKTVVTKEDKDGNLLSKTETTTEDGVETVVEYDGETPTSKTVTDTQQHNISTYTFDGNEEILVKEENTETGDVTTYENGTKTTTKADGQIIIEEDGVTTTINGNTVTVTDGKKTEMRTQNPEDGTEIITTEEDGVQTILQKKDDKNLSKTLIKDGQSYSVEYDGAGNTKGVIVQNGESPAVIAKKFGCSVDDLMKANADVLKGKKYFQVGAEIVIPREIEPDEFAKLNENRKTADEAKAEYAYQAQLRAENQAREQAELAALGIVNRNGAGTKIDSKTKPTDDGKFANFNKNDNKFKNLTYTVVGETGTRGRMVVKGSDGKYYTMAKDGMILKEGYAIATNALDKGQTASRNDGHGRRTVTVDGKEYVFSSDGKLLKSGYVEASDARDKDIATGNVKTAVSNTGVTYARGQNGETYYFDENGKALSGEEYQEFIKKEGQEVSDVLYKAAHGMGTDEEKLAEGINDISSSALMQQVNNNLKAKGYKETPDTTPVEDLLIDELSRSEVRQHIRTMAANGAYGTQAETDKAMGRNAAREIKYEVHGGVFGYTGTQNLKEAMGLADTRDARLTAEKYFQNGEVKGTDNDGSMIRQYIAEDGWNAEEVDRFDAVWVKNGAYDEDHDQEHRNAVTGRLIFTYDSDESLHAGLDAINSDPHSADYKNLTARAIDANKTEGYEEHFTNQEVVQIYLAGRTAKKDGTVDSAHVAACNTLLFKGEKPADIKAQEALYDAQKGKFDNVFDSMDPEVYEAMAEILANGDVENCSSLQEAYDKALNSINNPFPNLNDDQIKIKANAILSGQIEFSDDEVTDFCVKLMDSIGKNSCFAGYGQNRADYGKEQLKAILQARPEILKSVKEKVNDGNFHYEHSTYNPYGSSMTIKRDKKDEYLQIIKDTKYAADEQIFYDENHNIITDQETIQALTNRNMQTLQGMREYVAELEREFNKSVDAQGALSSLANDLSAGTGLGTDRDDVRTKYANAKLILGQLEAAAQGKLRDSDGNVVSMQDLAKQIVDTEKGLEQANSSYESTIQTGKMVIVLAPVIGATMVTGIGEAALGAGTLATAVTSGVVAGGTTYGMNALEYNTSQTGNTAEARESNAVESGIAGVSTAIGVGQMQYIGQIGNNLNTVTRTALRLGTTVAADTGVGAAGEYVATGNVTTEGTLMNMTFSVAGNAIGLKTLSENHVKATPTHENTVHSSPTNEHVNGRDPIHDGAVARNADATHLNANERRMLEQGLNDTPTPEELAAYHKEMEFQPVEEADMPAYETHQQQVAKDYAEAHELGNMVDESSASALQRVKADLETGTAAAPLNGKFKNANAEFTLQDGKIVEIRTNDGRVITDEVKIAKYEYKNGIKTEDLVSVEPQKAPSTDPAANSKGQGGKTSPDTDAASEAETSVSDKNGNEPAANTKDATTAATVPEAKPADAQVNSQNYSTDELGFIETKHYSEMSPDELVAEYQRLKEYEATGEILYPETDPSNEICMLGQNSHDMSNNKSAIEQALEQKGFELKSTDGEYRYQKKTIEATENPIEAEVVRPKSSYEKAQELKSKDFTTMTDDELQAAYKELHQDQMRGRMYEKDGIRIYSHDNRAALSKIENILKERGLTSGEPEVVVKHEGNAAAVSADEVEVVVEKSANVTAEDKMAMNQISNNINCARTLDALDRAQEWLDKMPESSQKSALQRQINAKREQLTPLGANAADAAPGKALAGDFSEKLPKNEGVVLTGNETLELANCELDLSAPEIQAKLKAMKDGDVITVGRKVNGANDIKIDDPYVSGKHLTIEKSGDKFIVTDMSTNGTRIGNSLPLINESELVRVAGNNGEAVNAKYVKTSREARAYLNEAIESGSYTENLESYTRTINEMHKISALGKSGNDFWYGEAGNGGLDVNPGIIRGEGGLRNQRIDSAREVEGVARKYGDSYRVDKDSKVKLDGISKSDLPADGAGGYHYYPDGKSLKSYYKQMHRTAKEALELIENGASEKQILEKIAEHYQYAANARPYGQINNSLFMNEVNTLLTKAGMNTIPHGKLDIAAMHLQPETFKKYFIDEYYRTRLTTPPGGGGSLNARADTPDGVHDDYANRNMIAENQSALEVQEQFGITTEEIVLGADEPGIIPEEFNMENMIYDAELNDLVYDTAETSGTSSNVLNNGKTAVPVTNATNGTSTKMFNNEIYLADGTRMMVRSNKPLTSEQKMKFAREFSAKKIIKPTYQAKNEHIQAILDKYKMSVQLEADLSYIDSTLEQVSSPIVKDYVHSKLDGIVANPNNAIKDVNEIMMLVNASNEFDGHYTAYMSVDSKNGVKRSNISQFDRFLKNNSSSFDELRSASDKPDALKTKTTSLDVIKSDLLKEGNIYSMREYMKQYPDSEMANHLYDRYTESIYVEHPEIKATLKALNEKYNTKVFIPHRLNMKNFNEVMGYIDNELAQWTKASNGTAKLPNVIDFSSAKTNWYDAGAAYGQGTANAFSERGTGALAFSRMNTTSLKSLRHEMTHSNDLTRQGHKIPDKYNLDEIMPKKMVLNQKTGKVVQVPDLENCKYVQEFINAGVLNHRPNVSYAYNNPAEFIAVASEGDLSKYSPEFKQILIDFGMPEWMFEMAPQAN